MVKFKIEYGVFTREEICILHEQEWFVLKFASIQGYNIAELLTNPIMYDHFHTELSAYLSQLILNAEIIFE